MATLINSPVDNTLLRLEARKSFRLTIWIKDYLGSILDITGTELRLVVREKFATVNDGDATAALKKLATIGNAEQGYAYFDIQADELNWREGEHPFSITLVSSGYSSTIIAGVVDIIQNTEFSSMGDTFEMNIPPAGDTLNVLLREQAAITVYAGQALAPGTQSFTDLDKTHLDDLWVQGWEILANRPDLGTAAYVNVEDIALPAGGAPGAALVKTSDADYAVAWQQIAEGGTGLDAAGQTSGTVPIADGANGWDWGVIAVPVSSVNGQTGAVILSSDQVAEGAVNRYVTTDQEAILAAFSNPPEYSDLDNLPLLGTASEKDVAFFLVATDPISNTILPKGSGLRGSTRGTAAPSGGSDGDWYRQYTP